MLYLLNRHLVRIEVAAENIEGQGEFEVTFVSTPPSGKHKYATFNFRDVCVLILYHHIYRTYPSLQHASLCANFINAVPNFTEGF